MIDRIAEPGGERTPFASGGEWPVRVDRQLADGLAEGDVDLIAFVFPLQLVASVLGFLARDVVAGTGMGILCGTWLSIGLVTLTGEPGATSDALGLFLLLAAVAMLVPASAAATGKLVATAIL